MGKVVDMIGRQCGRLYVLERGPDYIEPKSGFHRAQWLCRCSCGNVILAHGKNLRSGNTRSCGCLIKDKMRTIGAQNKSVNRYEFYGDLVIGYTQKNDPFYFDKEDYERVSAYCWYRHHDGYIFAATADKKKIALHRLVMNASADEQIDHINHQKENACKSNLRRVSHQENSFNGTLAKNNTSGRTGVNFNKQSKKWISRLMKSGKSFFLGAFDTFEEAVAARKAAEEKYFGDYSYDNSIAASPLIEVV